MSIRPGLTNHRPRHFLVGFTAFLFAVVSSAGTLLSPVAAATVTKRVGLVTLTCRNGQGGQNWSACVSPKTGNLTISWHYSGSSYGTSATIYVTAHGVGASHSNSVALPAESSPLAARQTSGSSAFTYTSSSVFSHLAHGSVASYITFDVHMTVSNAAGTSTSNTVHVFWDGDARPCPWYNPLCV